MNQNGFDSDEQEQHFLGLEQERQEHERKYKAAVEDAYMALAYAMDVLGFDEVRRVAQHQIDETSKATK